MNDWLAALNKDLDAVLDLDAGLADAQLPNLHTILVRSLDDIIDTDAGLAPLLRARKTNPPSDPMPSTPRSALGRFAIEFFARPLHERLATRTWFPQRELANVRSIAHLVHRTREVVDMLGNARLRKLDGDTRTLARDLAEVRSLVRLLGAALTRPTRTRAVDLVVALQRDLTTHPIIERQRRRAVDLLRALEKDLAHALAHARDVAQGFDVALAVALTSHLAFERYFLFEGALIDALDRLEQAVTDVMGADLTQVDLRGIPLEGLRWSAGTRWPAEWIDEVRNNSVELEPGVYEIRYGGVDALESQGRLG